MAASSTWSQLTRQCTLARTMPASMGLGPGHTNHSLEAASTEVICGDGENTFHLEEPCRDTTLLRERMKPENKTCGAERKASDARGTSSFEPQEVYLGFWLKHGLAWLNPVWGVTDPMKHATSKPAVMDWMLVFAHLKLFPALQYWRWSLWKETAWEATRKDTGRFCLCKRHKCEETPIFLQPSKRRPYRNQILNFPVSRATRNRHLRHWNTPIAPSVCPCSSPEQGRLTLKS